MDFKNDFASRTLAVFTATLLSILAIPGGEAKAAGAQAQAPCIPTNPSCYSFDFDDPIGTVRSFTFRMPKPGKAVVQFHGAMRCQLAGFSSGIVNLNSQIVTNSQASANYGAPGGNEIGMTLSDGLTMPMNLASTRTIKYSTAGSKTVYFKLSKVTMNQGTACHIYSAYFTVMTFP